MKKILIFVGVIVTIFVGLNIAVAIAEGEREPDIQQSVTVWDLPNSKAINHVADLVFQKSNHKDAYTPIIVEELIHGYKENIVYVVSENGEVQAINNENGLVFWRITVKESLMTSPVYLDGKVIVVGEQNIHAFDARNGEGIWTVKSEQAVKHSPIVASGNIIISSLEGNITSFTPEGEVFWETHVPELESGLVSWNDSVIAATYEGKIIELNSHTGQQIWSTNVEGKVLGTPGIVDHSMFVGTSKGVVHAIDLITKEIQWRSEELSYANRKGLLNSTIHANGISTSISGNDQYLAFGTVYEVVYIIDREDGQIVSVYNLSPDLLVEDKKMMTADPVLVGKSLYLSNRESFYSFNIDLDIQFEYDGFVQKPFIKNGSMVFVSDQYLYSIN